MLPDPDKAASNTAWSLLGSPQNGQAAVYLFTNIHYARNTFIPSVTGPFCSWQNMLGTACRCCQVTCDTPSTVRHSAVLMFAPHRSANADAFLALQYCWGQVQLLPKLDRV